MKTLLVTSDLHLSDRIWKHLQIEDDSYYSWRQIVELAIEHRVDGVLLAGDILDKQINQAQPIANLFTGLSRLADKHIPVFFNQGQHEYQGRPWLLVNGQSTVTWLHERQVLFGDWKIVGCDYQGEERFKAFLKSTLALSADVLVCHQVWQDFMGENAKPQASFSDIPGSVRCLITGDYHKHILTKHGEMIVLSPGSTHLRSLSEPQDKEVFLLSFAEDAVNASSLPLVTRRLFEFNTVTNTLESALASADIALTVADKYANKHAMPESVRLPLFRIIHSMDDVKSVSSFKARFSEKAHLFFKPLATADSEVELPSLNHGGQLNLLGCLDSFVNKDSQPAVHALASALLSGAEPEQALQRWVEEQINV